MVKVYQLMFIASLYCCQTGRAGTVPDTNYFRHDYTYQPEIGGWLKRHIFPRKWEDARLSCFYEGAVLASPINYDLYASMIEHMRHENRPIFIGVFSFGESEDFVSIEGIPLTYMTQVTWAQGEPNDMQENERCLTMNRNGSLADANCGGRHPYMCYKADTGTMTLNRCGTADREYIWNEKTGSCYKYHGECAGWAQAHAFCTAEEAQLAIVNSKEEAKILYDIFHTGRMKVLCPSCSCLGAVRVGTYNWAHIEGLQYWLTVDGKTLEAAGFDTWEKNEPNNINENEYCGGLTEATSSLNDINCDTHLPFICEVNTTFVRTLKTHFQGSRLDLIKPR